MASLFEEDVICVSTEDEGCKFGLVIENSEYFSSDDEVSLNKGDTDDPERLKKGNIRVAWYPSGEETVVREDEVRLCDRSLMPGDVVTRHLPGHDSQRGLVMDIDKLSHLHILRTNKYIYNVNARELKPIQKFRSGLDVILDLWWGKIETVISSVDLLFSDGHRCRVDENEISGVFEDTSEKQRMGEFSMWQYYPGQKLQGHMSGLSQAKWLAATPSYCHRVTVTIEKVEARSIIVNWVFGGNIGKKNSSNPPPRLIEGDNLKKIKLLDWFDHYHYFDLNIGGRFFYRIKNDDKTVALEPKHAFKPNDLVINKTELTINYDTSGNGNVNKEANFERLVEADTVVEAEAAFTTSWAKVIWQDGLIETRIPSVQLLPVHHLDDVDFLPGYFVLPRNELLDLTKQPDYGVVVTADHAARTVRVHWYAAYDAGTSRPESKTGRLLKQFFFGNYHSQAQQERPELLAGNCEVSAYDLRDHPDYVFRPGQSVMPVGRHREDKNMDAAGFSACQTVGQIYELDPSGSLVIKWCDGSVSRRYPQEVVVVSDDEMQLVD